MNPPAPGPTIDVTIQGDSLELSVSGDDDDSSKLPSLEAKDVKKAGENMYTTSNMTFNLTKKPFTVDFKDDDTGQTTKGEILVVGKDDEDLEQWFKDAAAKSMGGNKKRKLRKTRKLRKSKRRTTRKRSSTRKV
jgi:hypothetical protein